MKLLRAKFVNWGPHLLLDLDLDASVVGLVGINGSGKTRILRGLKFVFTGMLEGKASEYVRNLPKDNPPSNGSVTVDFAHGGVTGRIMRRVGKSPLRSLEWDGETYKKAADIDRILAEILDCDKKAIDQAVFLSQGHLADLLFSTPAKREEMFQKVLMLEHLERVSDIFEQKATGIASTLEDLTAVRDESRATLEGAETQLSLAAHKTKTLPDPTGDLNWLTPAIRMVEDYLASSTAISTARSQERQAQERLGALQPPAGVEATEENLVRLKTDLQATRDTIKVRDTAQTELGNLLEDRKRLAEAVVVDDQLREEAALLEHDLDLAPKLRQEYEAVRDQVANVRNRDEVMERQGLHLSALTASTANLNKADVDVTAATAAKEVADSLQREKSDLLTRVELVTALSGTTADGNCCPLCDSAISVEAIKAKYDPDKLRSRVSEIEAGEQDATRVLQMATAEARRLATARATAQTGFAQCTEALAKLQAAGAAGTVEALTAQLEELAVKGKEAAETDRKASTLAIKISSAASTKEAAADQVARHTRSPEELQVELDRAQSLLRDPAELEKQITDLATYIERFKALKADHASRGKELTAAEEAERLLLEKWKAQRTPPGMTLPATTEPGPDTLEYLKGFKVTREEQRRERDQARGAVEACQRSVDAARKRAEEIEERINRNAATREVIAELNVMREAFSKAGISRQYLLRAFSVLAERTQANLDMLDADFQVEADSEQPFNFLFWRTDQEDEVVMDQSQLSGGQRVRLSTAFLQSLQDLIFVDLNFLVLDEPSTHLDDAGVESLASMLRQISERTQDQDAQMIVCDHRRELRSSFGKCVSLTPGY